MSSRHRPSDDHRESARRSRDAPSTRDERSRNEPRSRTIREDPMDVDMDDDSDGPPPDRHSRPRDQYTTSAPISRNMTQTTSSTFRHRDQLQDEPEPRNIIDLAPSREQTRVRPGADFWIPNEGIEREVIQYEITRYLGQNALVRPGRNDSGRNGYLITAFRAPTTEMIRSMKEASEKFVREKNSRNRPEQYSSSRTANDRDRGNIPDRDRGRDQDPPRSRRDYPDSDDGMEDAPPVGRGYYRDDERRQPGLEPRPTDRHRDRDRDRDRDRERERDRERDRDRNRDREPIGDPRYQDPRIPDNRIQDPRYQPDPRMQDSRMQDPRMDPRYQETTRYQDLREAPLVGGRHPAYTSSYSEPQLPSYVTAPQVPGFDYNSALPRTPFSDSTPPPTGRRQQPMYQQTGGYPPVSHGAQMMVEDPQTGRPILVPVPTGGFAEPRSRHDRRQ